MAGRRRKKFVGPNSIKTRNPLRLICWYRYLKYPFTKPSFAARKVEPANDMGVVRWNDDDGMIPPLLLLLLSVPLDGCCCGKQIHLTLWDMGVYRNGFSICDEISMSGSGASSWCSAAGSPGYRFVLYCVLK